MTTIGQVGVLDDERPVGKVPTFAEYAKMWIAPKRARCGCGARHDGSVPRAASAALLPTLGALPLTNITRETIRTLLGVIIRGGNRK